MKALGNLLIILFIISILGQLSDTKNNMAEKAKPVSSNVKLESKIDSDLYSHTQVHSKVIGSKTHLEYAYFALIIGIICVIIFHIFCKDYHETGYFYHYISIFALYIVWVISIELISNLYNLSKELTMVIFVPITLAIVLLLFNYRVYIRRKVTKQIYCYSYYILSLIFVVVVNIIKK